MTTGIIITVIICVTIILLGVILLAAYLLAMDDEDQLIYVIIKRRQDRAIVNELREYSLEVVKTTVAELKLDIDQKKIEELYDKHIKATLREKYDI